MLFTFKTLAGEAFQLECDEVLTVADAKKRISDERGADQFPLDSQRLIYNAKVLSDEQKMGGLKYDDKKFIVIMVSKNKLPVAAKTADNEPASAVAAQPMTSKDLKDGNLDVAASTSISKEKVDQVIPSAAFTGMVNNSLQVAAPSNELVVQLVNMGYPHDEAIRALAAANNDLNVAVEYLVNGIEDTSFNQSHENSGQLSHGNLDFLRNNPQFDQIRQMIMNNPAVLPQVLQQMSAVNPDAMNLVSTNPDEFLRLLGEPTNNQNNAPSEQTQPSTQQEQQVMIITPEDREAVDRIKALGFSEQQAAEAYIACEKNEMLAANLLFNQMEQDGGN